MVWNRERTMSRAELSRRVHAARAKLDAMIDCAHAPQPVTPLSTMSEKEDDNKTADSVPSKPRAKKAPTEGCLEKRAPRSASPVDRVAS